MSGIEMVARYLVQMRIHICLVQADVGHMMSVTAKYEDGQGLDESKSSSATALVTNVNNPPTGSVTPSVIQRLQKVKQ